VTVAAAPEDAARVPSSSNSGNNNEVISSNSSPAGVHDATVAGGQEAPLQRTPGLVEENNRLRKENSQINEELTQLKGLCSNIFNLMNNYDGAGPIDDNSASTEGKSPLDLMPANYTVSEIPSDPEEEEDETNPRLFGVSIGMKRVRDDALDEEEEVRNNHSGCDDMKSETLDENSGTWLQLGKS
jgi:heat shock transcription factor